MNTELFLTQSPHHIPVASGNHRPLPPSSDCHACYPVLFDLCAPHSQKILEGCLSCSRLVALSFRWWVVFHYVSNWVEVV